jgi:anoctamin-10
LKASTTKEREREIESDQTRPPATTAAECLSANLACRFCVFIYLNLSFVAAETKMLPPAEKTPVVILQWTQKALKRNNGITTNGGTNTEMDVISMVKTCLEAGNIVVLPNAAQDVLLLTATQQSLEAQAERCQLIKERYIVSNNHHHNNKTNKNGGGGGGGRRRGGGEMIMDHFQVRNRLQFSRKKARNNSKNENQTVVAAENNDDNRDSFGIFTVHERSHLVWELLDQISVFDKPLLHDLLVEGPTNNKHSKTHNNNNNNNNNKIEEDAGLRFLLQSYQWIDVMAPLHIDKEKVKVQKHTWYPLWQMMPPVDEIQDYYGPSIAYYFAWMGCLGQWTSVLGIFGLSAYLFRTYRGDTQDEDEYTPFYGVFCFVWAILFLRYWDREEHRLAYRWGTMKLTNVIEDRAETDYSASYNEDDGAGHRRPEFRGYHRISPITGLPETYYPPSRRKVQYLISAAVTTAMLAVAFCLMILSLNLQGDIRPRPNHHPFYYPRLARLAEPGQWFDAQSKWKCYLPVVIHAAGIITLNTIYRRIARRLTDWENHRTQDAYDNSFILKRFLFEAFDCYIVLFYLAFCECNVEKLNVELVAIFNIDSFRRLGTEVLIPMIRQWRGSTGNDACHPHDLHLFEYEQFDDYTEILIQFGYVTLFASAYPLASLLMSAAIWLEIRSDCYKLTYLCQKPVAERVPHIGMWKLLLQNMVWLSCLTNCMLFGFTSDQMMHYMPNMYFRDDKGYTHLVQDRGWIAIIIIFLLERVLIYLGLALHVMIPKMPEDLMIQIQRRQFLLCSMCKTSKEKKG